MWNTLTAGLHMVQEKLDNVLDDPQSAQGLDETDHETPIPPPLATEQLHDTQVMVATQPPSPMKVHGELDAEVLILHSKVHTLQLALEDSQQQTQLINSEYRKLLAEKQAEIQALGERLCHASSSDHSLSDHTLSDHTISGHTISDHTHILEILQKELAAHKEMVTELRAQLVEKDTELQELNTKAETKFSKLRMQAKNKILSLTREMEKLKGESREGGGLDQPPSLNTSCNVSALDDSLSPNTLSPATSTEHAQSQLVCSLRGELDDLRAELVEKRRNLASREEEVSHLMEDVCQDRKEREQIKDEMVAWKNKLNVSEVCLQKEQGNRVTMELQMLEMEEQLDRLNSDLSASQLGRDALRRELEKQKSETKVLSSNTSDLTTRLNHLTTERGGRSLEEEAHSHQCLEHETLPTSGEEWDTSGLPLVSVLAAGERGSLIDMESEIARLESVIREQDGLLSSFKDVLDEKETKLHKQEEIESQLSGQMCALNQLCQSKDCQIENLDSKLAQSSQDMEELKEKVDNLESSLDNVASHGKELEETITKKNLHLYQLEIEIEATKVARERVELELARKSDEVSSLSDFIGTQNELIEEKESEILRRVGEIGTLEVSVQSSENCLRQTVEGSEEAAKILESNVQRIQELEQQVLELQDGLMGERENADQLKVISGELEKELVIARESLKEMKIRQRETEELNLSFSSHREKTELEMRDLEQKLEKLHKQVSTSAKEQVMAELANLKHLLTDKEEDVKRLESEREDFSSRFSELQSQATKLSGALELAQQNLSCHECTIENLSVALEQKKAALATIEREMTQVKGEHAEELKESLQNSVHVVQTKALLEEVRAELSRKEVELKLANGEIETSCKERLTLSTEFAIVAAKLDMLEKEREASKFESETLRGQVESLSGVKVCLSQEQRKHTDIVADLNSKLARSSDQMNEIQSKLQTARKRLSNVTAERDDVVREKAVMDAELARNVKENQQMKQQFDSAVKLMDSKLSEQTSAASRMMEELELKVRTITTLRDQQMVDSRKSSELLERVMKVSADYKVSSDRCRLLENEKVDLQRRVRELATNKSHLEHTCGETVSDRDAIRREYEVVLNGMQEQESRVLNLTEQLAQVAREKHSLEDNLREMSRQLLSSEQEKLGLSSALAELQEKANRILDLDKEKLVWLKERKVHEEQVAELRTSEAQLRAQSDTMKSCMAQIQDELLQSHAQLQTLQSQDAHKASNEEMQRRLLELEHAHIAETSRLQLSHTSLLVDVQQELKEEREKRELAERLLEAHRDSVSISMEDVQPFAVLDSSANSDPKTFVNYMNLASSWVQRLLRNPSVVLTRLLRSTPRTKLFCLAYFVFIHLILLVLFIAW